MSLWSRQRKPFDDLIDGPLLSADALKQRNLIHGKSTGMDSLVLSQQFPHRTGLFPETGQRNMRPEGTLLLPESTRCQSLKEFIMQPGQLCHRLYSGPEVLRAVRVTKTTHPGHGKIKRLNGKLPGRIANVRELLRLYTAEKRQCQMQLVRLLPAGTRYRLLNRQ